jgi:hypothetical protein
MPRPSTKTKTKTKIETKTKTHIKTKTKTKTKPTTKTKTKTKTRPRPRPRQRQDKTKAYLFQTPLAPLVPFALTSGAALAAGEGSRGGGELETLGREDKTKTRQKKKDKARQ